MHLLIKTGDMMFDLHLHIPTGEQQNIYTNNVADHIIWLWCPKDPSWLYGVNTPLAPRYCFQSLLLHFVFSGFCKFPWQHPGPLVSCLCLGRYSMAPKHLTHVIVDMITQVLQSGYYQPCCIHMKNSCLRCTTDKTIHKATVQLLRNNTSLFTVREIKLLCSSSAFKSRQEKKHNTISIRLSEWLLPASRQFFQLGDISSSVRPNSAPA